MKIFDRGVILPPPLNFLHSLKIFDKGLILPPPLNFYIHVRSSKRVWWWWWWWWWCVTGLVCGSGQSPGICRRIAYINTFPYWLQMAIVPYIQIVGPYQVSPFITWGYPQYYTYCWRYTSQYIPLSPLKPPLNPHEIPLNPIASWQTKIPKHLVWDC